MNKRGEFLKICLEKGMSGDVIISDSEQIRGKADAEKEHLAERFMKKPECDPLPIRDIPAKKEPSAKMRLNMSRMFGQMKLSSSTVGRITSTFTTLEPGDHDARESLAAKWIKKLETCITEKEVQKMLDEMGL